MTTKNIFKSFRTSPEIIRPAVMYYVRYPLSFRQIEDIMHERGIHICHETVRYWFERFGAKFAKEIRKKRVGQCRSFEVLHPCKYLRQFMDKSTIISITKDICRNEIITGYFAQPLFLSGWRFALDTNPGVSILGSVNVCLTIPDWAVVT